MGVAQITLFVLLDVLLDDNDLLRKQPNTMGEPLQVDVKTTL